MVFEEVIINIFDYKSILRSRLSDSTRELMFILFSYNKNIYIISAIVPININHSFSWITCYVILWSF